MVNAYKQTHIKYRWLVVVSTLSPSSVNLSVCISIFLSVCLCHCLTPLQQIVLFLFVLSLSHWHVSNRFCWYISMRLHLTPKIENFSICSKCAVHAHAYTIHNKMEFIAVAAVNPLFLKWLRIWVGALCYYSWYMDSLVPFIMLELLLNGRAADIVRWSSNWLYHLHTD